MWDVYEAEGMPAGAGGGACHQMRTAGRGGRKWRMSLRFTWASGCVTLRKSLSPWATASFLVECNCSPCGPSTVMASETRCTFWTPSFLLPARHPVTELRLNQTGTLLKVMQRRKEVVSNVFPRSIFTSINASLCELFFMARQDSKMYLP